MVARKDEIDVSVIMLTYNHENYIAQAIESVLLQETDLRYELIIGDDASTDRTPEIVREYAQRRPDVIRPVLREKNLGTTKNNWDLLRRARGKYIAGLEGDDYWIDPRKTQRQFAFLESHPEYVACCAKCVVVDENGVPDKTQTPGFVWYQRVFTIEDYLARWKLPGHSNTMLSRNIFREMKPEDYRIIYTAHESVADKTVLLLRLLYGPVCWEDRFVSAYRHVIKKDGQNYFSRHYANPYRNHDMFLYSCRLEDWARKNAGIREEIGKQQKKTRFCRFTEECARQPTLKRLGYLAEMILRSHAPVKYAKYAIKTLKEMRG